METQKGKSHIDLNFRSDAMCASSIRTLVTNYFTPMFTDPDVVERIALAAHELAENATLYTCDENSRIRIELQRDGENGLIRISTWNRADAKDMVALRQFFDEMRTFPDPFTFYQVLLRRTAKRNDGSGLGLARIEAEADMTVNYVEPEENVLCIEAHVAVPIQVCA